MHMSRDSFILEVIELRGEWVMSHINVWNESCYISMFDMSHVTYQCVTWVMSNIYVSHVTYQCVTWVMSNINIWHESCHISMSDMIELELKVHKSCHISMCDITSRWSSSSYLFIRHVTHHPEQEVYTSCHVSMCDMTHLHMWHVTHQWVLHIWLSHATLDWVMSHIELSHGTHMDESFHTHERDWGRSRARGEDIVSPGTESCHIWLSYNERVKSHKWIKPEEIESKRGRDLIAVAHNHQIIICCVCVHVHVARIKESCRT